MRKLIQLGIIVVLSALIILYTGSIYTTVSIKGLFIIPVVVLGFAILGTLVPSFFAMGVQGFSKAGIIKKLIPVVYVALILFFLTKITQTYATAVFASFTIGNTISYLCGLSVGVTNIKSKGGKKK